MQDLTSHTLKAIFAQQVLKNPAAAAAGAASQGKDEETTAAAEAAPYSEKETVLAAAATRRGGDPEKNRSRETHVGACFAVYLLAEDFAGDRTGSGGHFSAGRPPLQFTAPASSTSRQGAVAENRPHLGKAPSRGGAQDPCRAVQSLCAGCAHKSPQRPEKVKACRLDVCKAK